MRYVKVKLSLDDLYCLLAALTTEIQMSAGLDTTQESELLTRVEAEQLRCTYHPDEETKEVISERA